LPCLGTAVRALRELNRSCVDARHFLDEQVGRARADGVPSTCGGESVTTASGHGRAAEFCIATPRVSEKQHYHCCSAGGKAVMGTAESATPTPKPPERWTGDAAAEHEHDSNGFDDVESKEPEAAMRASDFALESTSIAFSGSRASGFSEMSNHLALVDAYDVSGSRAGGFSEMSNHLALFESFSNHLALFEHEVSGEDGTLLVGHPVQAQQLRGSTRSKAGAVDGDGDVAQGAGHCIGPRLPDEEVQGDDLDPGVRAFPLLQLKKTKAKKGRKKPG
jgi:hypothetical protein